MPISIAALFGSLASAQVAPPRAKASGVQAVSKTDWREQYAYSLGLQAYIFGFPYVYLPSLRADWVTRPKAANDITPYAPINHFSHVRDLADASYRGGGSPNQDTLYSTAWLDVGKEPVILSHPDMGDRYFAFELASIDNADSLIGRLGLSLDQQRTWRDERGQLARLDVYGIANLFHEFLDGTNVNVSGVNFANANDRPWGGLGVGGTYSWANGRYALYGEVALNTSLDDFRNSYSYKERSGSK